MAATLPDATVGAEEPTDIGQGRKYHPGPDRPVILHRFKYTNDVALHAHASTNSVRRNASRRALPGAPAVVSGGAPEGDEFVS